MALLRCVFLSRFSRSFSKKANESVFETVQTKGYKITPPSNKVTCTKEDMLSYWNLMAKMRRMEIVADNLYKQKLIRGFCHLYDGQEAVAVGMEAVLKRNDYMITSYRAHCQMLGRGDSVESIIAELLGRKSGCSRGKGGSMHMYRKEANFYGGNGIVGAQMPLGTGLAFASKYLNQDLVSVSMCGDGAANQGQFFEAANMAYLWKLPAIYVVENNEYGMGTSTARAASNTEFYSRMDVIPGLQVDGHDALAVRESFRLAADHCRGGKGPIVLEMKTYRYHGHSMSDPGITYRSREEVQNVRENKDCIEKLKKRILDHGWATEEQLKEKQKEINAEIDAAVEKAKATEELPLDQVTEDIFTDGPPAYVRFPANHP